MDEWAEEQSEVTKYDFEGRHQGHRKPTLQVAHSAVLSIYFESGLTCGVPDGVLDSSVGHDGRRGEPLAGAGRAVALK